MEKTLRTLIKHKVCNSKLLIKFKNTPELHNFDLSKSYSEINTSDYDFFEDINWLITNKIIKCDKLSYRGFINYSEEYTFDSRGNWLSFKTSDNYSIEYTYDDNGNRILSKDSDGNSQKYEYDEYGIQLIEGHEDMKYNLNDSQIK